jgi:hypothetical protein
MPRRIPNLDVVYHAFQEKSTMSDVKKRAADMFHRLVLPPLQKDGGNRYECRQK